MAILLNRKYGSRLECLYYILKSCYAKYGAGGLFCLNDLKFREDDESNVYEYCRLTGDLLGIKYCPFLVNPLDSSRCYATQSTESDSTKSKAASDIGGSLEALGFIERTGAKTYRITALGERWASSDFFSSEWEEIARVGVLSYGVVIGFLSVIRNLPKSFSMTPIYLGYPQTEETVQYTDQSGAVHTIDISTDSERDSVIRTKSRVALWCISVGLLEPVGVEAAASEALAHLKYRDFLNEKQLTVRSFRKTELAESIFDSKFEVSNPLSYSRLHKSVRALREHGGEILRLATMQNNEKILNRRFVFTYVLNYFSKKGGEVDFELLVSIMTKYSDNFFTAGNNPLAIMATESQIADLAGIPFDETAGKLKPLTTVSDKILCEDAPTHIVELAKEIIKELESSVL